MIDTTEPDHPLYRSVRLAGLVADPANRYDNLGMLRIALDLRPKPLHVDIDQPRVGCMPISPDLLKQHLAAEDLPGPSANASSRSNSSGVSWMGTPSRFTEWPSTLIDRSPIRSVSASVSSEPGDRRNRVRIRATNSFALNGLAT